MTDAPTVCDRVELGDALSRAMEPEAWAEYDAGNGVCSNQAGWKCLSSMERALAVMNHLATLGPIVVPLPTPSRDSPALHGV